MIDLVRRIPKFPLKMANGANVRSIEELRSNADIDTIVSCYQNGTLSLWCRAFGYHDIPERFESINLEMVKSIFETLDIPVEESAIRSYIEEHGISVSAPAVKNVDMGEPIVDNEEVKKKLSAYVDDVAILSDYAVDVLSVNDEEGNLVKCKITIANAKTEQFTSFVLPYDVGGSYTKKKFADDLLKKIAYVIYKQKEELGYLKLKNSRYAELNAGDVFQFGNYDGKPISWRVLDNNGERLFCISEKVICDMPYIPAPMVTMAKAFGVLGYMAATMWDKCSIRKWLNNEFYTASFTDAERELIVKTAYSHGDNKLTDYFYLLGMDYFQDLDDTESMKTDKSYWIRPVGSGQGEIIVGSGQPGFTSSENISNSKGVRPVFTLKY